MNLNTILNIGQSGLTAAQAGTATASHNIANSATDGFSRRSITIDAIPIDQGGGARARASVATRDQFLDKRLLSAGAQSGDADGRVQTLQVLDSVFSDDAGGVGGALDAFESSLTDLAAQPSDAGMRQAVLAKAGQLTQAVNQAGSALADARTSANATIASGIADVNQKITEIGQLTKDINLARVSGQDQADLIDQRDRVVHDLSKSIPISSLNDTKGNFTLMLSGSYSLVDSGGETHALQANLDPGSGDVRVYRKVSGVDQDVTRFIQGGSIGGNIAARDGALSRAQSSLDQFAFDLTQSYNTAHSQGVGLDGASGRNLFTPIADVAGAATQMSVSSDVANNPDALAAASAADLPGDNRNALALSGLSDQSIGSSGTAQNAFSSMIAAGGNELRGAMDRQTQANALFTQVDTMRESAQGVSSDDEMISLMRYQRAYQASLRVIETADQMMQQLLSMGT